MSGMPATVQTAFAATKRKVSASAASGAVNGTGCTVMRLMTGVTDILTLGFDYGSVFNDDFRPFVWQSRWLPPKPEAPQK